MLAEVVPEFDAPGPSVGTFLLVRNVSVESSVALPDK